MHRFARKGRQVQAVLRRSVHFKNEAGIYHLQNDLQSAAFGRAKSNPADLPQTGAGREDLLKVSLKHLARNNLLDRETMAPQKLDMEIPGLCADSIDLHFQQIGNRMLEPYISDLKRYLSSAKTEPFVPTDFKIQPGWTAYSETSKTGTKIDFPTDKVICFDVEVMHNVHPYAVMAVAVGETTTYVWLSPWLLNLSENEQHLVPLGEHEQVVIGHNVSFDRQRVLEEYSTKKSRKWFLDTMSLHTAVNGMCNQQQMTYRKYTQLKESGKNQKQVYAMVKNDPWLEHTCGNSLRACCEFHLGLELDKTDREAFDTTVKSELNEEKRLQELIRYCWKDSVVTKQLCAVLLPKFMKVNPHPVTLAALRHLGSVFLPVNEGWNDYAKRCEHEYATKTGLIDEKLRVLADNAVTHTGDSDLISNDPWLRQLDWTVKPIRYTVARKGVPSRPVKNQKMPGKPQWYKDLFSKKKETNKVEMSLTARTRTTVLLLRLRWMGQPLVWDDKLGWCYLVNEKLNKLPHPEGDEGRCTYPFAKFYLPYFENGTITSDNEVAKDIINTNIQCSYWLTARKRVFSQYPLFNTTDKNLPKGWGIILPQMVPIGAVTRRAVESTWLTASNAKKMKIGSELKSNVRAPPGFKIVGADVDSEELWIAGVIADSVFKMHGGTAIGWMTLEGTKAAGTDMHSKSAGILEIKRNEAKVFNYGRIYGAGVASASRNLQIFNPKITPAEAVAKAQKLYAATKGNRFKSPHFPLQQFWYGGTESVMFNQLEQLAELPRQQTPVLAAGISDALTSKYLGRTNFMTTRVNWSIQSSGVDYLHLLIASMEYLTSVYNIDARLLLTVHDEVRYLVKEKDQYRAALALQVANLWTRCMFCDQLGFDKIPFSASFFSAVDVDHCLRKEADDPCITITQVNPIESGESLSLTDLMEKCKSLGTPDLKVRKEFERQPSTPRTPVMAHLNDSPVLKEYLEAQIGTEDECREINRKLNVKLREAKAKAGTNSGTNPSAELPDDAEMPKFTPSVRTKWRSPKLPL